MVQTRPRAHKVGIMSVDLTTKCKNILENMKAVFQLDTHCSLFESLSYIQKIKYKHAAIIYHKYIYFTGMKGPKLEIKT